MRPPRVLVVEDDFLIRMNLVEVLTDAGFDVVEAADGDCALDLLDDPDGFAFLVTDFQMPGAIDGVGVAMRARMRFPDISVVMMTGRADALAGFGLGPRDAFVAKPYAPSDIVRVMERIGPRP
jgi:CheY-like chemotaxis protein